MNETLAYLTQKLSIRYKHPSPLVLWYGRNQMCELFRELGYTRGVEVGTDRGLYAQKLCASNPQLHLTCVDPWQAYGYYHPHVYHDVPQSAVDACYAEAVQRLAPYNCEIVRETSMNAVQRFDANSLDFVFIDGNHALPFIAEDIEHWSTRVRVGGIVYGHDYLDDVKLAVDSYMTRERIEPWFVLHRGGKLIQCWMYVRQ